MELTIFNLNTWLLCWPFSILNTKRLYGIIALIKESNPDLITLQEVWLHSYVSVLRKELPEYTFLAAGSNTFNTSGLVTGTKKLRKFTQNKFEVKKGYSLVEKFSNKGVHIVELSEHLPLLVNTHLYAAPKKVFDKVFVVHQFNAIINCISSQKSILAGDLNMKESELLGVNTLFEYIPSGLHSVALANPFVNFRFNICPENTKFDYVMPTKNSGISITEKIINNVVVSDHYPILATVTL